MKKNMMLTAVLTGIFMTAFSTAKMNVNANEVTIVGIDETYQYGSFYDSYCGEEASDKSKNLITMYKEFTGLDVVEEEWNKFTNKFIGQENIICDYFDSYFDILNFLEEAIDEELTAEEAIKKYAMDMLINESPIYIISNKVVESGKNLIDKGQSVSESTVSMVEESKEQQKTVEEYFSYYPDQKDKVDKQIAQIVESNNKNYEAQVPDFEKYGLSCDVEMMKEYDYRTICYENPSFETVGKVVFCSDKVSQSDSLPYKEGYEWLSVEIVAVFGDDNAWNYGVSVDAQFEDYYNIRLHDDTSEKVVIDDTTYMQYTVICDDVEYDECLRLEYGGNWSGWSDDQEITFVSKTLFRVPVGYDGTVAGVRNASEVWGEGQYIFDLDTTKCLFYRLP